MLSGTAEAQLVLDKGLRGTPTEQLATISQLSRLIEDHPVPTFVNAMLLRVADAFKDGSLPLRVAIARALSQCGSHLTLAFSVPEIFRRFLTVSHSNDPNARETVLDVLAELSPLLPESNQCHHLIRESLSTDNEGEYRATCRALKAFASLSHSFAESIVLQIGKILEEDEVSESRKVMLCSSFSTMSATAQVVEQVFEIANIILRRTISDEYFNAFLSSTTSLCIEIRYAISKQIALLLDLLNPSERDGPLPSKARRSIILKELRRLANFSNIWTEEQVNIFVGSLQPGMNDRSLMDFFEATTSLSKNCPQSNLSSLKGLVMSNTGYGSHVNPEVSIRFVYFASQVFCSPRAFENETPEFIESTMTAFTVVVVSTCTCGKLKRRLASKLYRAVGDLLLTYPHTQYPFALMIISAVFSAFDSPITNDNNQKERLELMCRLVDSEKLYILEIQKWACSVRNEKKRLFDAYPSEFSYLCVAVGTSIPPDFPSVFYNDCSVLKYDTARSAFRNGHWKKVAAPNLESIDLTIMPQFERNWITALRNIAESQLTELGLDELEKQQSHLISALAALKSEKTHLRFGGDLRFPIGMVSAMLSSSYAYFHMASVMQPFLTCLSGALKPDAFFNPVMSKRFLVALTSCESSLNDALAEWSSLCRASFCADPTSFDLITLFYLRISILLVAVKVLLKKQSPDTIIQIPALRNARTCSLLQRERLEWAINKIRTLQSISTPNINIIKTLYTITEQLATTPYMLPRFFFQQFYFVDFKLSTTPQAERNETVTVMSGDTVPVRVDGAITSTHPSPIRSIIVFAEVVCPTSHTKSQILKEVVDPTDNKYFTAQFLLTFKTTCEVKFRIEFIDQISRKQWNADGGLTLPIMVREKPQPTVPEMRRGPVSIPTDPRQMVRNSMFPLPDHI
ncbi:hypothetical protein GCK72_005308 [Caenorhabditis remanei]|uniref:Integrator complex subunit 7 n=1 Tax=Caenorhabditis remanei TaxID=31234 RepID=A0A6A5HF65_CAERE|nr:hypothetical protein GCK72_005308 [Caenorhabditis remanei]KAF1765356.1 hypothetical protein GCK72_005308 [Caenorhabditis remanei]